MEHFEIESGSSRNVGLPPKIESQEQQSSWFSKVTGTLFGQKATFSFKTKNFFSGLQKAADYIADKFSKGTSFLYESSGMKALRMRFGGASSGKGSEAIRSDEVSQQEGIQLPVCKDHDQSRPFLRNSMTAEEIIAAVSKRGAEEIEVMRKLDEEIRGGR